MNTYNQTYVRYDADLGFDKQKIPALVPGWD